jgi:ferredoxin-NADP reductase
MVSVKGQVPFFKAGQYINLFVNIKGIATSRPYTISSPPGKPYLDITIRRKPDGFVSPYLLDQIKPGDILESTGPVGTFCYEPLIDAPHLVFLAGGSGITPFTSIIRDLTAKHPSVQVHLLYGSRIPEDVIFKDELTILAAEHPDIKMDMIISEPPNDWDGNRGFLDKENIESLVGSIKGKTFFICGPIQMQTLCEKALTDLGVPKRRIKTEACSAPEDVSLASGWPGIALETEFDVVEERSGISFKARAGEPLMNSLEKAGLVVPVVCRSGECAACRTKLVSGCVYSPGHVHRRWADKKSNYIHPCMSYPIEDLRIRL